MNTTQPDILTPDQAAAYLQVNRETIYRYIREGKIIASRLGRAYRIPKGNLDLLLLATRTRPDIPLRDYDDEIARFLERDRLDPGAEAVVRRLDEQVPSGPAPGR